jgi:uncharacterized alpha-E superfamily protein
VISRVADQCFWLGRYLERAESTARLLQATRSLVFDSDVPVTQCWQPLVIVSGEHDAFVERYGAEATGDGEVVQRYMTWSEDNQVSLATSIRCARESARIIRDALSMDVWEEINELYLWFRRDTTERMYWENREQMYRDARRSTQLCLGLVRSTMLHDTPMSFLWLGVMLERIGQTARILDMHPRTVELESAHDIVQVALWLSLLRACSGSEAYMKRSQGRVSAQSVVSFLVFENSFPRSLRYCLRSSEGILREIWPESPAGSRASTDRLQRLLRWLDAQRASFDGAQVHSLLTHLVDETTAVCIDVSREILGPVHAPPTQSQSQAQ